VCRQASYQEGTFERQDGGSCHSTSSRFGLSLPHACLRLHHSRNSHRNCIIKSASLMRLDCRTVLNRSLSHRLCQHRIVHHHHCPFSHPLFVVLLDVPFWRHFVWNLSIIIQSTQAGRRHNASTRSRPRCRRAQQQSIQYV
jgi:hypothetical protein